MTIDWNLNGAEELTMAFDTWRHGINSSKWLQYLILDFIIVLL